MTTARKRHTIPTEAQEQKSLVKWLSLHPLLRDYFCKIDNEGDRKTIIKDGKVIPVGLYHAQSMGLRSGVSDLFIYYPTKTYSGMWVEMKRDMDYPASATVTDTWIAQEAFQKKVRRVGYHSVTCYGWEEAKKEIEEYLLT